MPDDGNQADSDLFDTDGSESSTDAASTTETENEDLDLSEESKTDNKPVAQGEIQRGKMVNAATLKVMNGELDLENLPSKQKWMKPLIEQQLGLNQEVSKVSVNANQIVKDELAKEREAQRFTDTRAQLQAVSLTKEQKTQLQAEYKDLLSSGLSPAKALDKAIKIAQIELNDDNSVLRQRMQIPKPGDRVVKSTQSVGDDLEKIKTLPEAERMKHYELLEGSTGRVMGRHKK